MKFGLLIIFSSLVSSCGGVTLTKASNHLEFSKFEKFQIGIATKAEAERKFGKPSKVYYTLDNEVWAYSVKFQNQEIPKAYMFFNKANILKSKTWYVFEEFDGTADWSAWQYNLQSYHFVKKTEQRITPHEITNTNTLQDTANGVYVELDNQYSKVSKISWGEKLSNTAQK